MKTKKDLEYNIAHTKQRLKERYNLNLDREAYIKLCNVVRQLKKPISIEKQKSDTQKIFETHFQNKKIKVVWSVERDCITTVL